MDIYIFQVNLFDLFDSSIVLLHLIRSEKMINERNFKYSKKIIILLLNIITYLSVLIGT